MDHSINFITWLGDKKSCYWPGYENSDFIFYSKVKYFNTEFEVGSGVYVPGIEGYSKQDIARIHCFYENPKTENKTERYRAIIEVFVYPEAIRKFANGLNANFNEDIDIVQMTNTTFFNTSIDTFRGRCNIIFALANEDSELVLHRYAKQYKHPIYVCRYKVDNIDSKYTFKCAISNKIVHKSTNLNIDENVLANNKKNTNYDSIDSDDDVIEIKEINKKVKNYRVTSIDCEKDAVKLRLKRQSFSSPEKIKNNLMVEPTILLERLNIEDKSIMENQTSARKPLKNLSFNEENTPSPSRRSARAKTPVDYKPFLGGGITKILTPETITEVRTSIGNNESKKVVENSSKSSRRKQVFTHKMYNSQDIEIEVKKELPINKTPTKITKRRNSNLEKATQNMKTPTKANTQNKKRENSPDLKDLVQNKRSSIVYKQRNTKVVIVDSDDSVENEEKSPLLIGTSKNIDCLGIDVISSKMQAKLGIVTPQKTQIERPTPQRRRLAKLDEESDEEPLSKTPRKNKNNEEHITKELPTRKSTRISLRNTPRKILVESDDEELFSKTPKKSSATPSKRATPLHKKISAIREECYTPKKETPKRKKIDEDFLESTPKKNVSTPKKGTPSRIKITSLSAQIESRANEFAATDNPFELARAQLHATLKPGCLPCREKEFDDITQFINGKLTDNSGGCMYISGVPGTGKTATVCEIMKVLNDGLKRKVLSDFKFISVNALSLTEPKQVYVEIVKQMVNKTMHWDEALTYIRSFFLKQKHALHVLLIDELDKLCTRKQDVIYNLLDLPSQSKTPLVVITIANTMDLPERLLSNKVNSRLGLTRLTFRPYKHKELIDIVKARLSAYSCVFRNEALEFVARKVAAVSGDARRALAICSRATEIAEASKEKEITMDIVNKTLTDMISSPKVQAIKSCSQAEKMILQSIVHEVSRTGNDEVSFSSIVQIIEGLCILESVTIPNINMLLSCCLKLHFFRLIIMQEGRHDVANTLLLNASPDDIHFALKEK